MTPERLAEIAHHESNCYMQHGHCYTQGRHVKELLTEIDALTRERDEQEQSFVLYDDAVRRGTRHWQRASGEEVWPDTARLIQWLALEYERLEKLDKFLQATLNEFRAKNMALEAENARLTAELP